MSGSGVDGSMLVSCRRITANVNRTMETRIRRYLFMGRHLRRVMCVSVRFSAGMSMGSSATRMLRSRSDIMVRSAIMILRERM